MFALETNCGGGAVTRINGDVGRQFVQDVLQRADEVPMVAAREVGATYTHLENVVAREEDFLICYIKADAAWSVAWTRNYLDVVRPEMDSLVIANLWACRGNAEAKCSTNDGFHVGYWVEEHMGVAGMTAGLYSIALIDETCTKDVVEMSGYARQS